MSCTRRDLLGASAAVPLALATPALAQSGPIRIGMITTLSGPGAALGNDIRDGFNLVVKNAGGRLGGLPVEVVIADDALRPENGRAIAERMVRRERIQVLTGIVFSNVMLAVAPVVLPAATYISANAGPSQLAGEACHANYFNVAWQNDNLHEAVGQYVTQQGKRRAYLVAPNYPAGRDALTGFKRFFRGEVVAEQYTRLDQLDYAAELAAIRTAGPEAVYIFLPGGLGINFIKQYAAAGLRERVPLYGPGFSFDQDVFPAVGEDALGCFNSSQWALDLPVPANRQFVDTFEREYGRLPSLYASQGYDAALLIGSAIAATRGRVGDRAAFAAALKRADFQSVRGRFRFGNNNHPIQTIYMREVVKDEKGRIVNRTIGTAFEDHQDAYAAQCKLT
ncbi:ABC transporter substrate-binding protein [Elioraea sp. Yellowstone]|jgi:branched-chain amino acid transport system substrate-binding protein|uniref:ABC transporter substrate-binding protein n=1 Tax=Elioraea sp. Yellowstone TaxID=2592070 RepID=UPI001F3CFD46|nr:ABC transporter substrate-binding protein [Elioraea sp. Yellowstone]